MTFSLRPLLPFGTMTLLIATAACNTYRAGQSALTQASGSAPARITLRLAPGQVPVSARSLAGGVMMADHDSGSPEDSAGRPIFVRVDTSDVDSLIVNVTQVQIRGGDRGEGGHPDSTRADSGHGEGGHPDSTRADSGHGEGGHPDSTRADSGHGDGGHPDSTRGDSGREGDLRRFARAADHGSDGGDSAQDRDHDRNDGWITLGVSGSGHLNLLALPTSADSGLVVATDSVPPGVYEHLRLFVTGPMIFFRRDIVTPAGDTLRAGTGYPVFIPSADRTGAAMSTDEEFIIPTGGGNVPVFFDQDDTIRHIVITGDGRIIVPPVIR